MEDSQGSLTRQENGDKQVGDESSEECKNPRRIIYFANGESMEEYTTEEEDAEENNHEPLLDTATLSWGSYLKLWVLRIAATSFFTCEFLGGKLATFLGLTEPKYQYAIDEYYRTQKTESESDEDGEEMPEMEVVTATNEKQHLEPQSLRYGSINCKEMSVFSQETTVTNVNELGDGNLTGLK
ncbi:protein FAM177B [Sceloporus undulatus]|uniref:protein FAM177B n=1 Tax=Sceloporus undulatus TaxID=8520 RepID=UPI001C4C78BA|nr:protein FAM177B [Sceloporus undulatus]